LTFITSDYWFHLKTDFKIPGTFRPPLTFYSLVHWFIPVNRLFLLRSIAMHAKQMTLKTMVAVALTAAILAGCSLQSNNPATITAPTTASTTEVNSEPITAPTVDLQPTLDMVRTQAARTVVAELTLNAPTATPVTPTSTATATATPGPTKTPVPPTARPTATFIPWTATPIYTATPLGYACVITEATPKSTDQIKVSTDFDGRWVVKNTGTITWLKSAVDFKYISGTKFQVFGDLFDMKSDVAPDASYTVIVDMKALADAGIYKTTWAIVQGGLTICTLDLSVTVVK
jgi:hypothetical protein